MLFIDGTEIDTANKFMVGQTSMGHVTIMSPPRGPISKAEALVLAAWIVELADDDGLGFDAARAAVKDC